MRQIPFVPPQDRTNLNEGVDSYGNISFKKAVDIFSKISLALKGTPKQDYKNDCLIYEGSIRSLKHRVDCLQRENDELKTKLENIKSNDL